MDWTQRFDAAAAERLPQVEVRKDEPMHRHTSFRIGGPARRMAFPTQEDEAAQLLALGAACAARPLILGRGSNLLVSDRGLDRLVICTGGLDVLEPGPEANTLRAGCGVSLRRAAEAALRLGLTGLEFTHGIPGSVGGGVCMNAGAYDGTMGQILRGATVLLPGQREAVFLPVEALELGYRQSLALRQPGTAILSAVFALSPGDPAAIRRRMEALLEKRRASQPLEYPSAGSFFKRPPGRFAGTLIQACGLKGLTVGGAQVSEKHAGFLINKDHAACADVLALMRQVQQQVRSHTGIWLEPEVQILT